MKKNYSHRIITITHKFNLVQRERWKPKAEKSLTLELFLPPAITFEIGGVTDNNYLSAKLQVTSNKIYGAEISLIKNRGNDGRHWWGGAIGHQQDDEKGFFNFDLDTYLALNYKFYRHGINAEGFHVNAAIRVFKEGAAPYVGFGYNF